MAEAKQSAQSGDPKKVVIKKYANRRLYNTAKSSYVTLDDLAKMVRSGEDFAVFDAKSGEDITRSVLTQIIVEEEAKDQNMLPTKFLRELIRLYGDPMQGVVPGYLDAAMEAFNRNQEQMRSALGGANAFGNFENFARANMDWFEQSMRMFNPLAPGGEAVQGADTAAAGKTAGPSKKAAASDDPPSADDLQELQAQMKDLQSKLEKLSKSD